VDRKKDKIISGGYNVYASEVENCLNKHDHVQNSAVFGIPDETWGEAVCAAVVLTKGRDVHPKDLIDYCKKNLTHYKVPKKLLIRDTLPFNSAGKVLRRVLRDQFIKEEDR
jgi:acyl-CoA synthetase (AMP-forming)/AMP-acid ligase II